MRRVAYPLLLSSVALTAPFPVAAQDEGGSMIERFLQDTLSGDDQNVRVIGLEGALSSRATIQEITVADDEGVWLTIKSAELDWNRLALLRGRFSVNALTAQEIDIVRTPGTTTGEAPPPSAESKPFQFPELPVSIDIGELRVDYLSLGEPLIGVAANLRVNGNFSMVDGALNTTLVIDRLDRAGDTIELTAGFENSSRQIDLDLTVTEAAGGLITTALGIPDTPHLGLTAKGSGQVSDFTADIGLSSDEQLRMTGQVRLRSAENDGTATDGIAFTADLAGDLTPFLAEEMDTFFGTETRLFVDGRTHPDGALDISDIEITSRALKLESQLSLGTGGTLKLAELQGRITPPDGERVVLPISGGKTSVGAAQISALFNAENGNPWALSLTTNAVSAPDLNLDHASITGQGTLNQSNGLLLEGDLQAVVDGLDMTDPALNAAVGDQITLDGQFDYGSDRSLQLSGFELVGSDYALGADAVISGPATGLQVDGLATLQATDLSRFADLAQLQLGGKASLRVQGKGSPLELSFDGKVVVNGQDLSTGRDDIDPLIKGETEISLDAKRGTDGITIREFVITGDALAAQASGNVTTPDGNLIIDGQASVNAPDLTFFSGLAKRDLSGAVLARVTGKGTVQTLDFDGQASVIGNNIRTGMSEFDPLLAGRTTITFDGLRLGDQIVIREAEVNSKAMTAQVAATIENPTDNISVDGSATVNVPDLALFSRLAGRELAGSINADVAGHGTNGSKTFDVKGLITAEDIGTGIETVDTLVQGRTTLNVDAVNDDHGMNIRAFVLNGTALTANASGQLDRSAGGLSFSAALDNLGRLSPTLSGPLRLVGNVAPTGSGLEGTARLLGPESSYANLSGSVDTKGTADLDFDARFNRIERFVPEFPGTISATGTAQRNAGKWVIDAKAEGPAQINSIVAGTYEENSSTADLKIQGGVNVGIANAFISPNSLKGTAQYDLTMKGVPSLGALSGTISTTETSMALPDVGQTITGVSGAVTLAQGRATVNLGGGMRAGGRFTVSGPVDLTAPFNTHVTTSLNNLVLTDKLLYETTVNGQIALTGALMGNSLVAGQIDFRETNINLAAASGTVSAAPIPPIKHLNENRAIFVTRERANLVEGEEVEKSNSRMALNVSLSAPKAVFVRGRGVNAELGGLIRVGGTTAAVVPSGQIELIRGNIDILGRRLALTKGLVTLQGDLTPYIEFESSSSTSDGTATIEIAGPLDSPEVDIFSDPERPTEEALAMLLFGNRFSELSPFVIAQMAASLAQLSGAGGDVTKGVRDATGLDTVDVGASEGGAGQVGVGAYLNDNLYTDFTVNTEGDTEVNLNLDVTDSFAVRGTVDGRGETGLGIFFQRDY